MNDDYGYFGKGLTGYTHYTEALKHMDGGGGGGGGGGKRSGGGWGRVFLILLAVYVLLGLIGESCY